MALSTTTMGTSSDMVLWRSAKRPFFEMMCVFDLRSCLLGSGLGLG